MKKFVLILLLQSGIMATAFGQFSTPDKQSVNTVKGKILLVETQEEVTRTLMDLRPTPAKQQAYKDGVANYNQMLKDAVEKYFTWRKGVEYMPALAVDKLVKDGKASKYAILHFSIQGYYVNPADIGPIYGGKYTDSVRDLSRSKGYGIYAIELAGNDKKRTEVFSVALPVAFPSAGDMTYAMEMMQSVFSKTAKVKDFENKEFRYDIDKYNKMLKKKTLLIEKGQITGKTTLADLKGEYPYHIEIVSYEKILDAVLQNDSSYAYVQVVPIKASAATAGSIKVNLRHLVVDAKDGKILGLAKPGRMDHDRVAPDITRKEIKEYVEE